MKNILFKIYISITLLICKCIDGIITSIDKRRYFEKIQNNDNYITTESGLKYIDIDYVENTIYIPDGYTVNFKYEGWLDNDEHCFTKGNIKARLDSGVLIKGINEALHTMKIGKKRGILINPGNGYGVTGFPRRGKNAGSIVPPNTSVHYIIELIDFNFNPFI